MTVSRIIKLGIIFIAICLNGFYSVYYLNLSNTENAQNDKVERNSVTSNQVSYGEIISEFKLKDIRGRKISTKASNFKKHIIFFFRPEIKDQWDNLFYANQLAKKTPKNCFIVIYPGVSVSKQLLTNLKWENLFFVKDHNLNINDKFNADYNLGATIIINDKNKVIFSYRGFVNNKMLESLTK